MTKLLALSLTFLADHFFLAFFPPDDELGLAATSFLAYYSNYTLIPSIRLKCVIIVSHISLSTYCLVVKYIKFYPSIALKYILPNIALLKFLIH